MSSAITLYGYHASGNCLKGKWVADHLGAPVRWVEIDIMRAESRTPEFLALSPGGQVPVAVLPDGRAFAQSNAIMLFLAEGSRLIPSDAFARARMYEWLFWEQYTHEPSIAVRRFRLAFQKVPENQLDPALLTKGEAALARMHEQLEKTPFLVGDALSLADIACVAYTRVAHEGGYDLAKFPAVKAWVARVEDELGIGPAEGA